MSVFGEVLLNRSRFTFYALAPFLLAGAAAITFPLEFEDAWELSAVLACDAAAILLVLSLWPYHVIPGVRRALMALVALAFSVYAIDAWFPGLLPAKGEPSDRVQATLGFLVVGLPCLTYTLLGRFRFGIPPVEIPVDDPTLREAVAAARASLDRMRAGFAECPQDVLVRFAFTTDGAEDDEHFEEASEAPEPIVEHLWGQLVHLTDRKAHVEVRTQPLTHSEYLDEVTIPVEEISDWEVEYPDGTLDGGFTVRAMHDFALREALPLPSHVRRRLERYRSAA